MTPVRLEPAALRSRVKHSTTEPPRSLRGHYVILKVLQRISKSTVPHKNGPYRKLKGQFTPLLLGVCYITALPVVLLYFSLTVKAATLIFISGCGSAISSAKEGKSGFIYNLVKS